MDLGSPAAVQIGFQLLPARFDAIVELLHGKPQAVFVFFLHDGFQKSPNPLLRRRYAGLVCFSRWPGIRFELVHFQVAVDFQAPALFNACNFYTYRWPDAVIGIQQERRHP
ncbi:MAG: hypothetical protein KDG53_17850 [Rhodocyclaceae bacterium]|nr:hypothetical protein [Rhodocyclaceae bacterium]MCW5617491.1 hypothetical protein [Rhodocyclaceae bacterium]